MPEYFIFERYSLAVSEAIQGFAFETIIKPALLLESITFVFDSPSSSTLCLFMGTYCHIGISRLGLVFFSRKVCKSRHRSFEFRRNTSLDGRYPK